ASKPLNLPLLRSELEVHDPSLFSKLNPRRQRGFATLPTHQRRSSARSTTLLDARAAGAPVRSSSHEMRSISCEASAGDLLLRDLCADTAQSYVAFTERIHDLGIELLFRLLHDLL